MKGEAYNGEETLDDFRRLTDTIHQNGETYLVCQITHSGRYFNPDGQHMAVCAFENPMIPKDPTRIITDEQLETGLDIFEEAVNKCSGDSQND